MQKATSVAMLIFVLSSMLAMGLGLTVSQIITPLRNARLVVLSLLANFVLMPLAAVALAALLRLDQPLGVGLLLLGTAAGAPFLPKLAQIAKGNLAFAVGLMVLLMVVTVGYLPLVLPVLLPGVSVNPAKIARSLFLLNPESLSSDGYGSVAGGTGRVRGNRVAHRPIADPAAKRSYRYPTVAADCLPHAELLGCNVHAARPSARAERREAGRDVENAVGRRVAVLNDGESQAGDG